MTERSPFVVVASCRVLTSCGAFTRRFVFAAALILPGCIVVPIGDLLKAPQLQEEVLVEGKGFFSKEKIAILELEGMISGQEGLGLLDSGENMVAETKACLDRMRQDPQVKAVVLRISSRGGEVTACDVLHHELLQFKQKTGLPLIASIGEHGTSGAYYVAAAADKIYAHPTAVVGSIGVILQHFDLSGLLAKLGVVASPIKSSKHKDLNSAFRPMADDERAVLQKLISDMYNRFVDVVDEGRADLNREEVAELADGRVVSGVEAVELKLVDEVGYLTAALDEAQTRAGVRSPTYVRYTRNTRSGANIYTASSARRVESQLELRLGTGRFVGPKLYYLWKPGLFMR